MSSESLSHKKSVYGTWLFLGLIILIAFGLRAWRIEDVPLNIDELKVLAYAENPHLSGFLKMVHYLNPESVPLYFILLHTAKHYITDSIVGLRLLNILISLSAIPLLFLLTSRIYDRKAGLTAALLLALSPVHLWHNQMMRFYVIIIPLTILSIYAAWRALRDKQARWLILAFLANATLVWTHAFLYILIVLELVFVFLANLGETPLPRIWLKRWIIVHVIVMLSPIPWHALTYHRVPSAEDNTEHLLPTLREFAVDLVADDMVEEYCEIPLFYYPEIAGFPGLRQKIRSVHPQMDAALFTAFALCLIWMSLRFLLPAWRILMGGRAPADIARFQNEGILLLYAVVPVTAHFVLSYLWRPCFEPRFTVYSTLGVYALAAGVLSLLPGRFLRAPLSLLLVGLFLFQLCILLPTSASKTDWNSALRVLEAERKPEEPILSRSIMHVTAPIDWFQYHWASETDNVYTTYSLDSIADRAVQFLLKEPEPVGALWAVINREFHDELPFEESIEPALLARNLRFKRWVFPGARNVHLYRISADPAASSPPSPLPTHDYLDYREAFEALFKGVTPDSTEEAVLVQQLRQATELKTDFTLVHVALDIEDYALALRFIDSMEWKYGIFPLGYICKAFALRGLGELEAARQACRQGLSGLEEESHLDEYRFYLPFYKALFIEKKPEKAAALLRELDPANRYTWQYYRQAVGLAPSYGSLNQLAQERYTPLTSR